MGGPGGMGGGGGGGGNAWGKWEGIREWWCGYGCVDGVMDG